MLKGLSVPGEGKTVHRVTGKGDLALLGMKGPALEDVGGSDGG